ncbi:hypothetical protein DL96DRAFT_1696256 [Flagelloscypha sp. PMI_526]|nr:hypothetical protein DL96DRAFT_1696256 [Flagelloscypha sp. PMI_526]
MPSVAEKPASLASLTSIFPLTSPVPTPQNNPNLLTPADVLREEDLLRNPESFRAWWTAIHNARDAYSAQAKLENPPTDLSSEEASLLGPLASQSSRLSLQRLTYLYESALSNFGGSFKLWKSYLQMRLFYVCGKQKVKKRAGGRKKYPDMKDALAEEKEDLEEWEGGLDPVLGWEEWKSLVATFERALMWLPKMPRIWLMYISLFFHPKCPPVLSYAHARRTFDRALRTLPPSLHHRLWVRYLLWASSRPLTSTIAVFRRYLQVDPSLTEHYTNLLLNPPPGNDPRPLEAAKLLLGLARKAGRGDYVSPEGKSGFQLLTDWMQVVEKHAEAVGLDVDETLASNMTIDSSLPDAKSQPVVVDGKVVRIGGPGHTPPVDDQAATAYDEDVDPSSSRRLNVEHIVQKDGLEVYKDQAGRLWTGLATYWINRAEFDRAKETFEAGISSVLTIRDFTQIFDAYAEFSESIISSFMQELEGGGDEEDEDKEDIEQELDARMKDFEELMDRRPFLVNDVIIRRNPNDVQEWEKRVALWGDDDEKVAATYEQALITINPRRATAFLPRLFVNFAKFYEEGGTSGSAEKDIVNARKVFERASKVPFRSVDDLAEIWCEWAEMELRNENYDDAIRVMQRATAIPKNSKISYHDNSLPVQARLFKSLKLWSFYVDLEESLGTVDTAKQVYDKILELKIANAQVIVNYANFLEEGEYWEESFKVYERGVELFTFPVSFEIWNIYLSKFIKRFGGTKLERARDLCEQALEKCPPKSCKPIFLLYARLEEDHGLAKRSMNILERATREVADDDKFELFTIYIAKATENYGLPATRPIYEKALEVLPDRQTAEMCLRYAALERKLGEIDRARAIYAHASQFCDPRTNPGFWDEWKTFEIETGSEDTFREMLRLKRGVQAQFNTEASYLAAQTVAAKLGSGSTAGRPEEAAIPGDAMAQVESINGPSFVSATTTALAPPKAANGDAEAVADPGNVDEIHISDDDDDM